MTPRLLIGWISVFAVAHGVTAEAAPPDPAALPTITPKSSSGSPQESGGNLNPKVVAAHQAYSRALLGSDSGALMALYLEDARSLNDPQPALYGNAQIKAWQMAIQARRRVIAYQPKVREVFDFGPTLIETGGFSLTWRLANGQTETAEGKYLHVWEKQADGALRLKAEVRNWVAPPVDERAFFLDLPQTARPSVPDTALAAELKALNERNASGVKNHDLAKRLSFYADDTILMPRNSAAKVGMKDIRPYLTTYVENGRGATFNTVKVWTEDYQDLGGGYVLEYFKFHVDWRSGETKGTVSGGGIRLWRRAAEGELKMLREIGTHDFRPPA